MTRRALDLLDRPLDGLTDEELREAAAAVADLAETDRRESQIVHYRPVSEPAWKFHRSTAKVRGMGGGNRAGKTTTPLVEIAARATGVFPDSIADLMAARFRGPLRIRIVVESTLTTLYPIILPKLQWWKWSGLLPQGGEQGHWGWIPRDCLVHAEWDRSWSEKLRTLTVLCRDPDDRTRVIGQSTLQFMSYDMDAANFASGDFDIIHHDEPPPLAIYRENEARVMSVGGEITVAMTWPDDPSIPVDWIFDEIYEPGLPGPNKSASIDWIELDTRQNPHLDQKSIEEKQRTWSAASRTTRIKGQPIRFSNLIHPLFTDREQHWCFACGKVTYAEFRDRAGGAEWTCESCGADAAPFNHVRDFEPAGNWPTLFVLDPHPRKPHMWLHLQVDPADDLWLVSEGALDGDPAAVASLVRRQEETLRLEVPVRLVDPNMGRSPSSAQRRERTWQDEFSDAGLACALADDSDVGRGRVNEYLRPDDRTHAPRLHFHPRCKQSIFQMKRYTWDSHRRQDERDLKEKPREKHDDYPTMLKYALNYSPTFSLLRHGGQVHRRRGRKGGY